MKVFITGATGFIGKAVVKNLIKDKHSVTELLLPQEDERLAGGSAFVRGDVTQRESLAGKMKGHDAVIHLAGAVGYQSWKNCRNINIHGARNVVDEAVHSGVRRFIHMSSVSVYGRVPNVLIGEDFPHRKIGDPYGDTKIDAENIIHEVALGGALDVTIIRPTAVYGEGDDKFLPKLIENLKSGKFRIVGSGEHSVDLINVSDIADFVLLVLKEPKSIGKTYNLANLENPSWNEMLQAISSELGIPMPEKHLPYQLAYAFGGVMEFLSFFSRKPPRLNRYSIRLIGQPYHYSTDRARQEMGFTPRIKLLDGVSDCLKKMQASSAIKT